MSAACKQMNTLKLVFGGGSARSTRLVVGNWYFLHFENN